LSRDAAAHTPEAVPAPGTSLPFAYVEQEVRVMRAAFHAELDELIADLARMVRLAGGMMNNASIALHQSDPTLAGRVIAERDQTNAMLDDTERRCITLLALQAPVAWDLRVVVAAFHAVGHVKRMANLARHIAIIVRLKHPNPMISGGVRPVLARMSLLASQLSEDAATAIEHQDPLSGDRLAVADDEVDALCGHLFGILFAEDWSHGVEQAVNAALIGRYYERFADHAVAIAGQVCYVTTGRVPESMALETASAAPCSP
jgi:phosphate transport system protein